MFEHERRSHDLFDGRTVNNARMGDVRVNRSNESGGFSGTCLNIITRVSKNLIDAYTNPNVYK